MTKKLADERYLLDTSALMTLIEDEPGADRVEQALKGGSALVPGIALIEVYYVSLQERGQEEADLRYALIKDLNVQILWTMDEAVVLCAGRLKAAHRLSLADSVIAAFAAHHKATLLHKDPEYKALEGVVSMESLPYKKSRR